MLFRSVERVSWDNCKSFCEKFGSGFRLPTEAEWEYASRAGSTTAYCFGDDGNSWFNDDLRVYGWFEINGDGTTHQIGQKKPNDWGLYDMHGNVWEWCSDWCGNYTSDEVTDPTGAATGSKRVYRGGSWYSDAAFCRSANRDGIAPGSRNRHIGFRLAISAPTVQ